MNKTNNLICAHCGVIYAVLLAGGIFGIAGWLPLMPASLSADEVAAVFTRDQNRILWGMTVLALSSVFFWPFAAAISMQMKRIEGKSHPLTYAQMASAAGTVMAVLLAAYLWIGCAFRPETTPPGTIQIFNDISWLMFIGCYPPAFIQNMSIAVCILTDKNKVKIYPRWLAVINLGATVINFAGATLCFDKTGPFAWDGIFGFWVVAVCYFSWIFIMWRTTVQAIKQEPAEEPEGATAR
jgi:hypothetical protein